MRHWSADPRRSLLALLGGVTSVALATTGEVTSLAYAAAAVAAAAMLGLRVPARHVRFFESLAQVVFILALAYFVWCLLDLRLLAGALALTLPVQAYCLLGPPTDRTLSRLEVVSFFQLVGLAASTTQIFFLPLLLLWVAMAPALLTLSALERSLPGERRAAPLPAGLLRAGAGAGGLSLVLGAGVFLLVPRYEAGIGRSLASNSLHLSGFSDEVRFGDISRIQVSDAVALRVTLDGPAPEPLLWRGLAFDSFTGHSWLASKPDWRHAFRWQRQVPAPPRGARRIVQEFRLEPMTSKAIFCLPEVATIETNFPVQVEKDRWGNYRHAGAGRGRVKYRVVSDVGGPPGPGPEAEDRQRLLDLPEELDARVAELARSLTAQASTDGERAAILTAWLRENNEYSLDVNDAGRDPLGRFILEGRPGHCEYFASALAVMLRATGVPARLVNGFRGGTYSRLFRVFIVRQRDAHSWVEAWLPGSGWTTIDPTPSIAVVAPSGALGAPRALWREILIFWDDSVIGFNYTYQVGFLVTAREWMAAARAELGRLSPAGPAVVAAGLGLLALWLGLRGRARRSRSPAAFEATVLRLLERRGYVREPGQTPAEIAAEAGASGGPAGAAAVELTRLYYAARFGGHAPDGRRVAELLARLRTLPRRGTPA